MKDLIDSLFASDFPSFVRECHKNCRDGETLDPDPYLLQVCAMAEDIAEGRVTRAAISMPPGTAKTFIFGVCLPAWILAHKPSATVLVVEHNKKMARDTTRNIRKIMMSKRFRRNFDTRIDQNWSGAGDFGTTGGGSVYATSVSGGITGFRADVIIVDDPVSIKNANNVEKLELVNQIFDNEILSRARRPDTRILIIMQRLNKKDLIGQLQPEDGFKKLELPLIADKDRTYICRYGVWNRKKGEQLKAGHFTKKLFASSHSIRFFVSCISRTKAAAHRFGSNRGTFPTMLAVVIHRDRSSSASTQRKRQGPIRAGWSFKYGKPMGVTIICSMYSPLSVTMSDCGVS